MEWIGKAALYYIQRIWNTDLERKSEWKGSYPEWRYRDTYSIGQWVRLRREEEGAEGLWRIHDKLYDLAQWIDRHPGGSSWITSTRGFDITEAFESHHVTSLAESILPKFYVREARTPRNSPFTFHEDGFFRSLKKEVSKHLKKSNDSNPRIRSAVVTDLMLATSLLLSVLAATYNSLFVCILAGLFLCFVTNSAHNYFHQKDNVRMFYFNLSLLSYRDWRISHAMSHHLYPNSRYDLEVTLFAPFFQWLPKDNKTFIAKYASWIYAPAAYMFIFHKQFFERIFTNPDGFAELIPLTLPVSMMVFGGAEFTQAFKLWNIIILTASFFFGFIGVNVAHHHPDIFHDGDPARDDKDWGLYQLDAVRERGELVGKLPLVMITYGDHSLHHLFPTLDHSLLEGLYPVVLAACRSVGYTFHFSSQAELFKGQYLQLARTRPRSNCKPCADNS